MKTRSDFVSNSSSCSFIVGLPTEVDIAEFKKILGRLRGQNVRMDVYSGISDFYDYCDPKRLDREPAETAERVLAPGCYVRCDSGSDHYYGYMARYEDMCAVFDESGWDFKIYADDGAHTTRGEDLPEP